MALELLSKVENKLLGRVEFKVLFKDMAGRLTRKDAVKMCAEKVGISEEKLYLIGLRISAGTRDVVGTFYFYENLEEAKKQLPPQVLLRMMPKEERKKILEEARKAKAKPRGK